MYSNFFIFFIVFFSGHGCPHPFSLFLRPLICIVNLCAHSEDPAFIACMSPLWQAGYSLALVTEYISPWQDLKLQIHHYNLFSPQVCINTIHSLYRPCAMPQFHVVRTHFSYADPTPLMFQDSAVKRQIKAKPSIET